MLNLTTANPVSWPTAPSTAVPPVPAIAAVQPVPGAGRDPQAGLGAGQDRATPQKKDRGAGSPEGAPLLPRGQGETLGHASNASARVADAAARKAAEEAVAALAEEQANAKEEIHQRLQEVLSTVWQASAAVVDRALGREPSDNPAASPGGASVSAVPPRRALLVLPGADGAVRAAPAGGTVTEGVVLPEGQGPVSSAAAASDLVAYDERGNGSVQAPEAGSLISRRV